jgi:5'(3')-deoxyribonucleotidase
VKIVLDLDSIVVDLMTPWLAAYNAAHDDNATMETFTTWDMHKHVKGGKAIYGFINRPGFFRHLAFVDGAEAAVKELVRRGHEIWLVSAAVFSCNYSDKVEWMAQYLPMIPKRQTALMDSKDEIHADVIIDDGPHNAKAYKLRHPGAKAMTLRYPYNQDCSAYDVIADSWEQLLQELP